MSSRERSSVPRRQFIGSGLAGVAALAAGSAFGAEGEKPRPEGAREGASPDQAKEKKAGAGKPMFALQLYSVRQDCERDLPGVIAAVAKMGYKGVEFAGYYGRTAKDLRALLDQHGLVCCGTHTGLDTLLGENLATTIEFNRILGNTYLVVPGLPGERTASRTAWLDTAKLFNELAEKVKPQGMRVGYHNHSAEFKPMEGELPWDTFMGNTRADVIMQLDTGNALAGGADPLPYLYRYPGRAMTVHVKEFSKTNDKALIGEGDINWKAFFALCRAVGGTEWYIVEQESYAYAPLECAKRCLRNLKAMKL